MKKILILIALLGTLLLGYFLYTHVFLPVERFITEERKKAEEIDKVGCRIVSFRRLLRGIKGWRAFTSTRKTVDLVEFEGRYYLATKGGLRVLSKDLKEIDLLNNLNGLAENNLTALAVYKSRLYIGTKTKGLMALYKGHLTHYLFNAKEASKITSLYPLNGFLYIGTFGAGVIRFDGRNFSNEINNRKGAKFKKVSALGSLKGKLVVGTPDMGLFILRGDEFINLRKEDGLLSNRIFSLSSYEDELFVSSPFGVNVVDEDLGIRTELEGEFATCSLFFQEKLHIGTFNNGIVVEGSRITEKIKINLLKVINGGLFALTDQGFRIFKEDKWREVKGRKGELYSNHLTSLALNDKGELFIGTFEEGVEILSKERIIKRLKEGGLKEINYLYFDSGNLWVATTSGVVIFDENLKSRWLREEDGLIGNNIMHIKRAKDKLILSTNKGVSIYQQGFIKSFYTLHGLINNRVYTSEVIGDRIFFGTLGGISVMEGERFIKTFTTANSKLSCNWITALLRVGDDLYIGTYGGGVDRMRSNGEWMGSPERFEVNFNAIYYEEPFLFVGTLDKGVIIYDTSTNKWFSFTKGLSSLNVTSIVGDTEYLYFATQEGLTRVKKNKVIQCSDPL